MKTFLISCFTFIILGMMTTANAQVQLWRFMGVMGSRGHNT